MTQRLLQRVLDIDLDFFVMPAAHGPDYGARLSSDDYAVWPIEEALAFLRNQCGLRQRLPGFVTEHHGELFLRWREAVAAGTLVPPFHVTHVDAHADLGLGDEGYTYVLSELLFAFPEDRTLPRFGFYGLNDGNHLLFAIACRWINDLVYVYGEGGGGDELPFVMEDFGATPAPRNVQLAAMHRSELNKLIHRSDSSPDIAHYEPTVPYASTRWEHFQADGPYDFVCLTHSPPFTPESADPLFDVIRDQLIEPI